MYLLFRYHNVLPSKWRDMGFGERTVLKSFIRKEIQDRKKELNALKGVE